MEFKFTLRDLNDAFTEYCNGCISNIDTLEDALKKENFLYLKAIQEFIFYFIDEYLNDYFITGYERELKTIYEKYKEYFNKSYNVIVYGQEVDASTADPVRLKGVLAADEEELREKVAKLAWNEGGIYNMTGYDVISEEDADE